MSSKPNIKSDFKYLFRFFTLKQYLHFFKYLLLTIRKQKNQQYLILERKCKRRPIFLIYRQTFIVKMPKVFKTNVLFEN